MTDPYIDPTSGVLRNLAGVTGHAVLAGIEADITRAALTVLAARPLPGRYDLAHLQAFHKRIFGLLYPWAGEVRTVTIAKTDMFCLPPHIEPYAADVFGQLAGEKHLRGLPRESFVDRVTHYFAEVNAIHPCREGNGRTQRAFFGQLSRDAEWPIRWSGIEPERNVEASIASLRGDNNPLRAMLDELIRAEPTPEG